MSEWSFQDTVGVLIIAGAFFAVSMFTAGILQTVAVLFGVGVLGLWILNSFLKGFTEGVND